MFSVFNPSKWSSGQPTLQRPGSSLGFGALLKGLTSVVDTSCQSWDSNPQPWVTSGFKSNALTIRPRLPEDERMDAICVSRHLESRSRKVLISSTAPYASTPFFFLEQETVRYSRYII